VTIETDQHLIYFKFEGKDWKRYEDTGKRKGDLFLDAMKLRIKHHSKDEDGWDYDEARKMWVVGDVPYNRALIETLREHFNIR